MPDSLNALNFSSGNGNTEKRMDFKNKVAIARLADFSEMEGRRRTGVWGIPRFLT